MSSSNFIKLFGIFFLSALFAEKLNEFSLHTKLYEVLVAGRGSETLEQVQAIFENVDDHFNNNFEGIELLRRSYNPEVVQYVLAKSVNMDPEERAEKVREILEAKLIDGEYGRCKLTPGEPGFAIAVTCLDEMKNDGHHEMNESLNFKFYHLLKDGNLPLVKKFVEAGFKLPSSVSIGIQNIKNNTVETINYLVVNGYDIAKEGQSIYDLMESKKIRKFDFQLYLDHGLPLDFHFGKDNWLELALKTGNIDIAMLVYKKGLRLFKAKQEYHYSDFQDNINTFVHRLALTACFDKTIELMYAGNSDPQSILSFMPKEMIGEIVQSVCEPDEEAAARELYV